MAEFESMKDHKPLMEVVNMKKSYGMIQALDDVSVAIYPGEVLGLLGDNGAGKSTLIKILSGVFPPDEGKIYFKEKEIHFSSPSDARAIGIETVYQDRSLIELLSITRNFFLGKEPVGKRGFLSWLELAQMRKDCKRVLEDVGVTVRSPDDRVLTLSGGERQAVSMGRCMYFSAKLLILDEPLRNLSVREQKRGLRHIKELRDSGVAGIFTTHNIYHVYPCADRFVILDKGAKIGEFNKKEVTAEDIIEIISTGSTNTKQRD